MKQGNRVCHIWIIGTISIALAALIIFASMTIYVDPFFHYHKPLAKYDYSLESEARNYERYLNDGIIRHFEYNGVITGTSMVENFKASEADDLFGVPFVKIPFSGAYYKEINENLQRAYATGKEIKYVIRCLDYSQMICDKDADRPEEYPVYLYNRIPFDDVNYVLNKEIFYDHTRAVMKSSKAGGKAVDFDEYANWNDSHTFGKEAVLSSYTLGEKALEPYVLSAEKADMVLENIRQNVTDLADEHPETVFYLFFPPYSICYWDTLNNDGQIDFRIDAEQIAIEELLKHPNIKLYSFCNNFDLVCDLDNYKDQAHYSEEVNSYILQCMHRDQYLITDAGYQEYIREIKDFYGSYRYDSLHE